MGFPREWGCRHCHLHLPLRSLPAIPPHLFITHLLSASIYYLSLPRLCSISTSELSRSQMGSDLTILCGISPPSVEIFTCPLGIFRTPLWVGSQFHLAFLRMVWAELPVSRFQSTLQSELAMCMCSCVADWWFWFISIFVWWNCLYCIRSLNGISYGKKQKHKTLPYMALLSSLQLLGKLVQNISRGVILGPQKEVKRVPRNKTRLKYTLLFEKMRWI